MARNIKKYMIDGMMGLIVGDALGCPVQFNPRTTILLRKQGPVTGMEGYGTFNMPEGSWTDDSSMALCTLASINECGRVDLDDIMDKFADWHYNGAFTPFGYAYDQGLTCVSAITNYMKHYNVKTCGKTGEHANGNGALMRILPACLYEILDPMASSRSLQEVLDEIMLVGSLTHNHLRSNIACGLYYFMVKEVIMMKESGKSLSFIDCLQNGINEGIRFYKDYAEKKGEYSDYVLSQLEFYRRLSDLRDFARTEDSLIRSSGYVVDTLEAAVWGLIVTDSFSESLLKIVNLGEDSDTVAAVAGGLAGLFYGIDGIPKEWLDVLQRKDWLLEGVAGGFSSI